MTPAKNFNPAKHPKRAAVFRDAQLAERAKALAPSINARDAAARLGISPLEAEQLAARHGFAFNQRERDVTW